MDENLHQIETQLKALIEGEDNVIANLANTSALINLYIKDINWVGFYLNDPESQQLVLGPFQGKPACLRIDWGKGVCGTSFKENKVQRVSDVHQFPGHIACDPDSLSEIVLPFKLNEHIQGVLDIDSPLLNRFQAADQELLEKVIEILEAHYH